MATADFDVLLGESAPPYIVVVIALGVFIAFFETIKRYQKWKVNIYEASFGGLVISFWLKLFLIGAIILLGSSVTNILLSSNSGYRILTETLIKFSLILGAYSYLYTIIESCKSFKELLMADDDSEVQNDDELEDQD